MAVNTRETGEAVGLDRRPTRHSPLHTIHRELGAQFENHAGWQVPKVYESSQVEVTAVQERVGVVDVSAVGKLTAQGDAAQELLTFVFDAVPEAPGHVSPTLRKDSCYIARLTMDEFLIVTPRDVEREMLQRFDSERERHGLFVTVVDQTSGLAGLLLVGPDSRKLLSKLCALPFGPSLEPKSFTLTDFPNHRVAQSSLAKVRILIVRNDRGDTPAFELFFERPYAEYVWESVMDAGAEFGIVPCGWETKVLLDES